MKIANAQLWVQDQEEALAFWTEKVGFEVRADVTMPEMGDFRWLTVGPPGQEDVSVVLMAVPGEPIMDAQTRAQVADLTAKGFCGTGPVLPNAGGAALRDRRGLPRSLRERDPPHPGDLVAERRQLSS